MDVKTIVSLASHLNIIGMKESSGDIAKISEQMRGRDVVTKFDYFFSENGLVAYKGGQLLAEQSILKKFGDKILQRLINFR